MHNWAKRQEFTGTLRKPLASFHLIKHCAAEFKFLAQCRKPADSCFVKSVRCLRINLDYESNIGIFHLGQELEHLLSEQAHLAEHVLWADTDGPLKMRRSTLGQFCGWCL